MILKASQAFIDLWSSAEPLLVRSLQRRGIAQHVVNDLVQDVALLAVLQAQKQGSYDAFAAQFDSIAKFVSWGRLRASWLLLDQIRTDKRWVSVNLEAAVEPNQEGTTYVDEIRRLILQLPKRQQEAIGGLVSGVSSGELASQMQVSEATVRSLQRYARAKLVSKLQDNSSDMRKE